MQVALGNNNNTHSIENVHKVMHGFTDTVVPKIVALLHTLGYMDKEGNLTQKVGKTPPYRKPKDATTTGGSSGALEDAI